MIQRIFERIMAVLEVIKKCSLTMPEDKNIIIQIPYLNFKFVYDISINNTENEVNVDKETKSEL